MFDQNHSHLITSKENNLNSQLALQSLQFQQHNSNAAMYQSQNLPDNSSKRNMHDPESTNFQKQGNAAQEVARLFQKNQHKSKNKFRMYGTKRCLPAYTAMLKGQDLQGKGNIQNADPNLCSISNDFQNNGRPLSNSNGRSYKKIIGAKKAVSPSSTIIGPDSKIEQAYEIKQGRKQISMIRNQNEQNIDIVAQQIKNERKKDSQAKTRMIGTRKKIRAHMDEIGFDLKVINRNQALRFQQNDQKQQQKPVSPKQKSQRKKEDQIDEINVNKFEEAQKKFLYQQDICENKSKGQILKTNGGQNSKAKCINQLGQTNKQIMVQTISQQQETKIPNQISNLTVFSKVPSVILTPSKKIKAYVQYIQPIQTKELKIRRGQLIEGQNKPTNSSNKNCISQDPNSVLSNKLSKETQKQQKNENLIPDRTENVKDKNTLPNQHQKSPQISKKQNKSKVSGFKEQKKKQEDDCKLAKKQQEKQKVQLRKNEEAKGKQQQNKDKRKTEGVANSSKSINAYFEFLEEKQQNEGCKKIEDNKVQSVGQTQRNGNREKSKKKSTMIGSRKKIQPYFSYIQNQPEKQIEKKPADFNNSRSDQIIEEQVKKGLGQMEHNIVEIKESVEKPKVQKKQSVKQLGLQKSLKAYVDFIKQPQNETKSKPVANFDAESYPVVNWFAAYNIKNNNQPFQLQETAEKNNKSGQQQRTEQGKKLDQRQSSGKQIRSQINLILDEQFNNLVQSKKSQKNSSSKILESNSSRKQLSSLKNVNIVEQSNQQQKVTDVPSKKQQSHSSNINLDKNLTKNQQNRPVSNQKQLKPEPDLVIEHQATKDEKNVDCAQKCKNSQPSSSLKRLSSLKSVKAYVEYLEQPKVPKGQAETTLKPQKQNPVNLEKQLNKQCANKQNTENKMNQVVFVQQSYQQMKWFAHYKKQDLNNPYQLTDKQDNAKIMNKVSNKQKVSGENVSKKQNKQKALQNQMKAQKITAEKAKPIGKNQQKIPKSQSNNKIKQFFFTPESYETMNWFAGYSNKTQSDSPFLLSEIQLNLTTPTHNNEHEKDNKIIANNETNKQSSQQHYKKYLSYSNMSESVVRIGKKQGENQLVGKNNDHETVDNICGQKKCENNEVLAKKQSNQSDISDIPKQLKGTSSSGNFILSNNTKIEPQKDSNESSTKLKQGDTKINKKISDSRGSKLNDSRGSQKSNQISSERQKMINEQIKGSTNRLIERAMDELQCGKQNMEEKQGNEQQIEVTGNEEGSEVVGRLGKGENERCVKNEGVNKGGEKEKIGEKGIRNVQSQDKQLQKRKVEQKKPVENKKEEAHKNPTLKGDSSKKQNQNQENKKGLTQNKMLQKRGSQIQFIPITIENDKKDDFKPDDENNNKTQNGKKSNGSILSHRSHQSGNNQKGSLKTLVRVSPKLERSQQKSCINDSVQGDKENNFQQEMKFEQNYNKQATKNLQKEGSLIRRQSVKKMSNSNSQVKKFGLYKFKQAIEQKQNINQSKKAVKGDIDINKKRKGKQSEQSEKMIGKLSSKDNSGQQSSSENNRNHLEKNRKGKISNPYLQPAFAALKLNRSIKNEKSFSPQQNQQKREVSPNNMFEEDKQSQISRRLRKEGVINRNKKNIAMGRHLQKLKLEYQKIKKIQQQSHSRRQRSNKVRSIQHDRLIPRSMQSDQNIRSHKFLKAHSHQFSYLYPTAENVTGDDKLAKKAKELNQKLKRTSYTLGKKRQIDVVHEFISQARRQVRQSQKFLEEME